MSSYVNIKTEWLTEWGLTPAEAVIYGYLYGWLEVSHKELKMTQADMAAAVGMKERNFKYLMARLTSYGCLTTERTGTSTTYHLHARVLNKKRVQDIAPSAKNNTECKILHREGAKNCTDRVQNIAPDTLYNIGNNIGIIFDDDARTRTREGEDKKRDDEQAALGQVGEVQQLADELRQEIDNGAQFAESAQRLYGMTAADLKVNLTWFCDKLRIDGVSHKSRSDFRRHFNNWLRIRAQQKILNQQHARNYHQQPTAELITELD